MQTRRRRKLRLDLIDAGNKLLPATRLLTPQEVAKLNQVTRTQLAIESEAPTDRSVCGSKDNGRGNRNPALKSSETTPKLA
jgi:hypothetical protein